MFGRAFRSAPKTMPSQPAKSSIPDTPFSSGDQQVINKNKFNEKYAPSEKMASPAVRTPPTGSTTGAPSLADAIKYSKAGDKAGAQATLSKLVGLKKGGKVSGSSKKSGVSTASKRGDGIASKGKTKGRMI
jgi:hypothetical protein